MSKIWEYVKLTRPHDNKKMVTTLTFINVGSGFEKMWLEGLLKKTSVKIVKLLDFYLRRRRVRARLGYNILGYCLMEIIQLREIHSKDSTGLQRLARYSLQLVWFLSSNYQEFICKQFNR